MSKSIVLYLHVHQPFRVGHYSMFDIKNRSDYFASPFHSRTSNERIVQKVAEKSYIPTNKLLLELLEKHPDFTLSISITGTVIEQFAACAPEVLASFQELVATGRVEIVGETYHHSLAFFYNREEFNTQVAMHRETVQKYFGVIPTSFRNTELAYNDELAEWADEQGYKAIIAEGWDPVLGWRSPNFVYQAPKAQRTKLLLKNYRLSDDIAFRFSASARSAHPLTASTFAHWLHETHDAEVFNLFMDYETFGEHQWEDTGIFGFLRHLPEEWLKQPEHTFKTISQAADEHKPKDTISMPETVTWADTERDLTAWIGNPMQRSALDKIYELAKPIIALNDWSLIEDWRKLQTSDHFYYMCTKWFSDGDVHAYFSPYESPYDAFVYFMNSYHDLKARLLEKGVEI
ncbi:alpha-amylase [Patescibacteria group bacterium]|nr:MAG: alpha-amylase [Patescibacteria group bacterium]